jgi:hypothetical protein
MTLTKDSIFEWTCTATLIAGVALTSFNVYPLNLWVSLLGNLGWLVLGWIWKKWSLILVEIVISTIYVVGIVDLYFLK